MFEISLSNQQIEYLIKREKISKRVISIFFLIWKIVGIIGILAALNSIPENLKTSTSSYENFLYVFTGIIGALMVAGFFLGIPTLIENSIKKTIKKLKKRQFKAYSSVAINKRSHKSDNNRKYYVEVMCKGQPISIKTTSTSYNEINIGDEVIIIAMGNSVYEMTCYSYSQLGEYSENIGNYR